VGLSSAPWTLGHTAAHCRGNTPLSHPLLLLLLVEEEEEGRTGHEGGNDSQGRIEGAGQQAGTLLWALELELT
jgi:hypothetical protein